MYEANNINHLKGEALNVGIDGGIILKLIP